MWQAGMESLLGNEYRVGGFVQSDECLGVSYVKCDC